ncbi:acyltransferase [Paenibacillus glycinis]|uniref:Acyltransferase n=1 Tax=Paenibacillus glycinis TaxID=2697035 RepID=A0ABW9XMF2_9BACL|nr:acyltransferase [Paenibacillus glycinis]NBD23594.1 acyltransferase [Paenibacillus glycinis]
MIYQNVGFYLEERGAKIEIGDHTFINRRTEIMCRERVSIGQHCAISWDVTIMDTDYHHINGISLARPVVIEDHVWVGCKSTILKGVTIGQGSIIAAGSLVNRDVPPFSLVGGVPARILKRDVKWSK